MRGEGGHVTYPGALVSELAWHFHEPHTRLDHCPRTLFSALEQGPLARRRRTNQVMVTELTAERPDRQNFRLHREFLPRISTFAKEKL